RLCMVCDPGNPSARAGTRSAESSPPVMTQDWRVLPQLLVLLFCFTASDRNNKGMPSEGHSLVGALVPTSRDSVKP
ncbi:MAG: hypothetical protein M3Z24_12055, partial [Chloroflexota bacterium]|nr:hypothetical protein [Chloroflexota bacterium]